MRHYAQDLAARKQATSGVRFNLYVISVNKGKAQSIEMPERAERIGGRISKRYIYMSERPCLGKSTMIEIEAKRNRFKL